MRQIPELLFMTDTLETADKNGVQTILNSRQRVVNKNGCNTEPHLKDPCEERQRWFNGYEAQNGGTGPYLSNTVSAPVLIEKRALVLAVLFNSRRDALFF